tara:strand:- start:298 stop:1323 length:1026 start_codon:yes stop_codon:yes gene_type:complete
MRWNPNGDDSRQTIEEYNAETGHREEMLWYQNSTYAWNPNLQDGSILRVTKSSMGTFSWCPQQYYLEKFKGLRGESRYYHTRGLNIHDMMEWFWENISKEQEQAVLNLAESDIEAGRTLLHSYIPQPPEPYEYGEEEQIRQWVDWQYNRLIITQGKKWRPAGVEANIHANRYVVVDDTPVKVHLSGFIDTLFPSESDGYALMELKSGKYNKSKPTSMRKEMAFYKMMLDHSPHHEYLPITHWGWEFPGGGIEGGTGAAIHYESATNKTGSNAVKSVERTLEKMVRAHIAMEFPPDPYLGRFKKGVPLEEQKLKCNWCDYKEHCEFWSVTDEYLDKIMEDEQ